MEIQREVHAPTGEWEALDIAVSLSWSELPALDMWDKTCRDHLGVVLFGLCDEGFEVMFFGLAHLSTVCFQWRTVFSLGERIGV